jgi:hypothetical protein
MGVAHDHSHLSLGGLGLSAISEPARSKSLAIFPSLTVLIELLDFVMTGEVSPWQNTGIELSTNHWLTAASR